MKKLFSSLLTIALPFMVNAQDCTIPDAFPANTGANMTVLLQPGSLVGLPNTSGNGYFVASAPHMTVGRAFLSDAKGALNLKVWGDDLSTGTTAMDADQNTVPVIEGANADDAITIQYVDGTTLYDVDFSTPISYTTDVFKIISSTPTLTECTADDNSASTTPDEWSSALPTTDNTGTIVFPAGTLTEHAGDYIVAVAGGVRVSEPSLVATDGSGGVAVIGTDSNCNCDLADGGEKLSFEVFTNDEFVPFGSVVSLSYSANMFEMITEITFQLGTPISYQLSAGWNMVGYVGTADNNGIVNQMNAALGTSDIQSTFQVIKNVKGRFWSSSFAQINEFIPGEGYMMYVIGTPTTLNFQSSGYISGIDYPLSSGWNMVAYTGDVDSNADIVTSIGNALPSGTAAEKFQVIKNVKGRFWSSSFAQINTFVPGEAYMMYVLGGDTSLNFQRE